MVTTGAGGRRPAPVFGPGRRPQALVVLAGRHRRHIPAVTHDDETGFLAVQELLDHHARAAGVVRDAQRVEARVGRQHELDRFMRLMQAHGHDHALACRQPVGLDHNRRAFFIDIGVAAVAS